MNEHAGKKLLKFPENWQHRHLLDLESLSAADITTLLDTAEQLGGVFRTTGRKLDLLSGCTIANLFFENSTRTRNSFSLAAKRL